MHMIALHPRQYTATPEIQARTISWAAEKSDETVKVEVWDVVDKGLVKPGSDANGSTDTAAISAGQCVSRCTT
jgi:hypothetical protein